MYTSANTPSASCKTLCRQVDESEGCDCVLPELAAPYSEGCFSSCFLSQAYLVIACCKVEDDRKVAPLSFWSMSSMLPSPWLSLRVTLLRSR